MFNSNKKLLLPDILLKLLFNIVSRFTYTTGYFIAVSLSLCDISSFSSSEVVTITAFIMIVVGHGDTAI